ncbi:MAG: hypothetical protein QG603_448, partial [Patescibacteria group bacterium]|nr:hypothetical protein [Patescibacteria group bacterium]
ALPIYKVSYSGITGENVKFTHFGSALGFLANDVVNVRVPVNATVFSPLSAVTFYASEADGISAAHQQLAYLFYRAYNLKWDTGTTSYLPNGNASYAGDNIYTGTITSDGQNTQAGPDFNPVILQVCGSDLCRVAGVATPGITINDTQSGNVSGKKSIFAAFKFYYYAHPDHMPIKNIIIDWGDSSNDTLAPGKYKNNIPECNPEIAMPGKPADTKQGFGGTDRACREAYKTFYHDYQYDINYPCDGVRAPSYTDITGAVASCYKPTVTVQDHWYTSGDSFKSTETYDDWVVVYKE